MPVVHMMWVWYVATSHETRHQIMMVFWNPTKNRIADEWGMVCFMTLRNPTYTNMSDNRIQQIEEHDEFQTHVDGILEWGIQFSRSPCWMLLDDVAWVRSSEFLSKESC